MTPLRWLLGGLVLVGLGCQGLAGPTGALDAGTGGGAAGGGAAGGGGGVVGGGGAVGGGAVGGGGAQGGGQGGGGQGGGGLGGGRADAGAFLRDVYPQDVGLSADPSVLFADDFEAGWGRWDSPHADTSTLFLESGAQAHAGQHYLRATVTHAQLMAQTYISASPSVKFPRRVTGLFWRYYFRLVGVAPTPHHWVRLAAGTPSYESSGLANTVPPGDQGFWFDFDLNTEVTAQFYVYWYLMRSGRCNDGSTTPGCAGDQGSTYHYGNVFAPKPQAGLPRDQWVCVELEADANTVGQSSGALRAWVNDTLLGEFAPGVPSGTWLRDQFFVGGCQFSACTTPAPFSGFDFRSSSDVLFKELFLDSYYELGSWEARRADMQAAGLTVDEASTILYDDIVVATRRIGCRR